MQPEVVVVGSYNQDHAWTCARLPQPGETISGRYATGPGGKGFNQAVASVRSGAATAFVAALGRDAAAQGALELAARLGLAMWIERPGDEPTGTAAILIDAQGRNQIVVAPGANAALSVDFVRARSSGLCGARVLLAQLEVRPDAVAAALESARAEGLVTILNPAPADVGPGFAGLPLADILTPNETEFVALLGRLPGEVPTAEAVAALDDASLHALCRRLPVPTVIVTLGGAGCFVSHAAAGQRGDTAANYRIPAEPVDPVDTTGAGDAFNGALAAELALAPTQAFIDAVRAAGRYAALSTERHGAALSMPSRDEVVQRFDPHRTP